MRITPTDWQTQVRVFESYGCTFKRRTGSHLIYRCPDARRAVVIPRYKEVSVSIIRNNMETAGMSEEEYFKLLNRL